MTDRQATCEERIDDHLKTNLDWFDQIMFRMDFEPRGDLDDMDYDEIAQIGQHVGELPSKKGTDDKWREISSREDLTEHILEVTDDAYADETWMEAPLSVEKRTTIIVQMSWGGPSDQFECVLDDEGHIDQVTYRFLDWFDGATREININHHPNLERFLQRFVDYETGNY
ncbi:hypothetical protein LCGC14_1999180 [marine sediment metagenome]|uniref:Uncharacterized protein n=1 Tax=marine sediment metagenome TaxID=412755 RepID=A0A0F9FRJ2_9ZZZZ